MKGKKSKGFPKSMKKVDSAADEAAEGEFKKGGHVKKSHSADGKKSHKRLDKFARGGKVSGGGSSPYSGAAGTKASFTSPAKQMKGNL